MKTQKQPILKLAIGLLLVIVGAWIVYDNLPGSKPNPSTIHSYAECVAAGYPNLKSYPGKCTLPDGTEFIQPIPTQSFEECAQWYPVMESYPRQCRDGNSTLWVEEIPST
ncbi:MAG: hypothetical protein AABW68_01085 [archaeon]